MGTHGITPEFIHDAPHCNLVIFQQQTELSVFLKESVVLYDRRCIDTFPLRFEPFC